MRSLLLVAFAASIALQASAQEQKNDTTKKELPLKTERTVKLTTDEGTWLSLDVSPDGRTIVFEMLGDIYTLPITGGQATRITEGVAYDVQPRFSPDGKQIAFVSDRSGSDNVWVMDADGKNAKAITKGEKTQYVSPEWTPDGKFIVVSRNAAQFAPQYDLYLYHKDGGAGLKMTGTAPAPTGPPNPLSPPPPNNYVGAAFGRDGRYVYVAARQGFGGYNQTSFGWQVAVYDRETGQIFARTDARGGAMRPVISPDGQRMVYGTRADSVTSLRLRDLVTGDERWLVRNVQRDDQESWRITSDLLPGSAFTPDGQALVTSFGGKLWKIDIASGRAMQIPFTAAIDLGLGPLSKFEYQLNDTTLTVQQVRGARPSPDGKRLAFTALDKVWVMDLPRGTPRRLTSTARGIGEHSPVWSPDARYIAYVTWTDQGGDVMRIRADGRARPERLTRQQAFYEQLNYTPEGQRLVVARGPRQQRVEHDEFTRNPFAAGIELVWLPAAGGDTRVITPMTFYGYPHFTRDTARVFLYDPRDGLVSMRFDGTDRKAHLKVTGNLGAFQNPPQPSPADEIIVSPEGDRVLAQVDGNVYVLSIPVVGGATPTINVANPANAQVPAQRLTRIGGDFVGWYRDAQRVHYSIGHSYFTYDLPRADSLQRDSVARADSVKRATAAAPRDTARVDTARAGRPPAENVARTPGDSAKVAQADTTKKSKPAYEPERVDVLITVRRDQPKGTVVLRGARAITMRGDEVIENADIVVIDNRISAVGARGAVSIPQGARVIDVAGKTIMPGWVDIHAHMWPGYGIHPIQPWEYYANRAYGVTTTRARCSRATPTSIRRTPSSSTWPASG